MVVSTFAGQYFNANVLPWKDLCGLEEWGIQNILLDESCKTIAGIFSMAVCLVQSL